MKLNKIFLISMLLLVAVSVSAVSADASIDAITVDNDLQLPQSGDDIKVIDDGEATTPGTGDDEGAGDSGSDTDDGSDDDDEDDGDDNNNSTDDDNNQTEDDKNETVGGNETVGDNNTTDDNNQTTGDNETAGDNNETVGDNETAGDNETDDNTTIITKDISKYYKNDTQFYATFYDADGNLLKNTEITFIINGIEYKRTTDENGTAKININLAAGIYEILTVNPVTNETVNNTITVLPTITGNNIIKYYRNGTQYIVTVYDPEGNPLANTDVSFNINGVEYTRTTDENGSAILSINLNPGEYIITATNMYNGEQVSNNITVLPTITGENVVKYYRNGTQYYVVVLDGEGNPVANENVTFNINGVFYTRQTNDEGIATLSINLNPGEYIITSENPITGEKVSNNVTVLSIIESEDATFTYEQGGKYTCKVVDEQGNPVANAKVTFNIHGKIYERTSDENGTVSLNINLFPGDYIITMEYNGFKQSNKIHVNKAEVKIAFKSTTIKSGQAIQYTVTSSATGKAISNLRTILYYLVDGSFNRGWYVYTNADGLASLKVSAAAGSYQFAAVISDNPYYADVMVLTTFTIQ